MNPEHAEEVGGNHPAHSHPLRIGKTSMVLLGVVFPVLLLGAIVGVSRTGAPDALHGFSKVAIMFGAALHLHAKWFWGYLPHPKISRRGMDIGILVAVLGCIGYAYLFFVA